MDIAVHFILIIIACAGLWVGADWLVESAARLARRLGISELVIGLTVVAFGTSAPELAVTVGAALTNNDSVSVANVVGSNIFNIGFILGGCALVAALSTKRILVLRDGLLLLVTTIALLIMLQDGLFSRVEGAILLITLMAYLTFLFFKREAVMDEDVPTDPASWKDFPMLLVGLAFIIGGGQLLVHSSVHLAKMWGMSDWLIGMTIVAAGTSLPEFAISLMALIKKHHGISAGNLIGSNIFNTLGVLGVAGVLRPLAVDPSARISTIMLIGLTVVVMAFMWTGKKILRWEGAVLIIISLIIWIYNIQIGHAAS